ncbi:ARM repeat-containing protein [Daedalea quercina L-15889]|uniref:ARM repeat-containing protein n=1 Tax=Daedalea quercina L-15889 TaxID=1314783 RepID=A0A165TF58_9APHY|nr:ARM repeat-containing protein [Daedalea quercina L-15889]
MTEGLEKGLDALLKKREGRAWTALLPDEVACLVDSFLPSQPASLRPKAYIALSSICTKLRKDSKPIGAKQDGDDPGVEAIRKAFGPSVVSRLSDTIETDVLAGMSFLTALFEVDWQSASAIFGEGGVLESVTDALDLFPDSSDLSRAVAALFANASGHKSCRALISEEHVEWLSRKSQQTGDDALKAAAAIALIKLSRGVGTDMAGADGGEKRDASAADNELAKLMKGLVLNGQSSSLADAVEGLAYMSTNPTIKESMANDTPVLSRLFSIIPRRKSGIPSSQSPEDIAQSPLYGVVVIIFNLCSYRPRLTDEQAQIAKLRRMANAPSDGAAATEESDPLDDDAHVKVRARKLVQAGALDALAAAVRAADSPAVRLTAGRAFLHIAEDKENRGMILQAGGSKALMLIIQSILPTQKPTARSSEAPHLEPRDIEPIQALAKLAITSAPVQVFGPNEGALFDAIRPLALMLVHPTSNLLQRFEALMALTNLASQGGEVAERISRAEGLLNKVELLVLEDHVLVRRAATELVCNLVGGCEDVYNKFGGQKTPTSKSKLQVLIALCDVDDLQTRLAASGAVATLTTSPDACQSLLELQRERKRVLPVLGNLVDPSISTTGEGADDEDAEQRADAGLAHRGVVCIRNIFLSVKDSITRTELATEAERAGIVRALVGVVQASSTNSEGPALRPAAEVLKWLLESGVQITA